MAFCIVTDSASDVPSGVIREYGLHVIPTPVTIEGKDYFDGETIFPDEFYRIQAAKKDIKTYHINQAMFYDHFLPFAQRGDEVLYICFSTGIAGTYNAAKLAYEQILEEYPEFQMTIIDTKCASIGYGLVTERILKMQRNGATQSRLPLEGTVLISVNRKDKAEVVEAARQFAQDGFHIVATGGTWEVLTEAGVPAEKVKKLYEGRPNVLDLITNGKIQMVVNSPVGKDSVHDDSYLRKAAIKAKIPYMTTIAAAMASASGIHYVKTHGMEAVHSLQELHSAIS